MRKFSKTEYQEYIEYCAKDKIREDVKDIIVRFGKMVAVERKKAHLTLSQLSDMSDVSIAVISDLENGKEKIPNLYTMVALARVLEIDNSEFIRLIFGEITKKASRKKSPDEMLTEALTAYGVPNNVAANILVGLELFYKKHYKDILI